MSKGVVLPSVGEKGEVNMSKYQLPIAFGPYPAFQAEQVTEEVLDCNEHYQAIERLVRGDITSQQFMYSLQFLIESIYASILEQEKQIRVDAFHDGYWEDT
jgi:hypothetical protein